MFTSSYGTQYVQKSRDIDIYTKSEIYKVKVPIIFLGTVGFSPLREGHYFPSIALRI